MKKYFLKFIGADASVVRASQRYLVASKSPVTPIQFAVYVTFQKLFRIVPLFFGGLLLYTLSKWQWGRKLLIKYPELFSFGWFTHAGPTVDEMKTSCFCHRFFAMGYEKSSETSSSPNWQVITRVDGPEPGYIATSIMITQCALVVLDNQVKGRGVITPASAFRGTSLIERLHQRGITFTVEKNAALPRTVKMSSL